MTGSGLAIVDNVKMGYAIEVVPGTTPAIAFQTLRPKSQSLDANLKYQPSAEFRADRQVADNILVDSSPAGQIGGELSFGTFDDFMLGAQAQANWTGVLRATNAAATSTSVYTIASGGTVAVTGHLVRGFGFTNAANNAINAVSASTATTVTVSGTPLTIEAAGAAKGIRIWGFTSTAGDIAATLTGLSSTTLDFTTLGLTVGQWIWPQNFATGACNTPIRITAITAHAITCDNLPTAWAADAGTAVAIRVQMSEFLRNGVTPQSYSIERVHSDTTPVQYFAFKGFYVDKATINLAPSAVCDLTFDFKGQLATQGTTSASTGSYLASTSSSVMSNAGVLRLNEGGTPTGFLKKFTLTLGNTTREQKGVGTLGNIGIGQGRFMAQATFEAYFTSGALYQKFLNATTTSLATAVKDNSGNAYVFTLPLVKLSAAKVTAGAINQDVTLQCTADAQIDSVTGCMAQIDRFAA